MRGAILNQSFGFLTPGEIARGLVPSPRTSSGGRRPRISADPIRVEVSPTGCGKMRVYRDDASLGDASDYPRAFPGVIRDSTGQTEVAYSDAEWSDIQQGQMNAQAALNGFLSRVPEIKATASRGLVDQAHTLLADAFRLAQQAIHVQGASDAILYTAQSDALTSAYADAYDYLDTFAAGAVQLRKSSASATGAVVAQNVAYESSGQAEVDRQAQAAQLASYRAGGSGLKNAVDMFAGNTIQDDGVITRAAGGADPGFLQTAGKVYARAASDAVDSVKNATDWSKAIRDALAGLVKPAGYVLAGYVALKVLKII